MVVAALVRLSSSTRLELGMLVALAACAGGATTTSPDGGNGGDAGMGVDGGIGVDAGADAQVNQPPKPDLSASATAGPAPLAVTFDASASFDPDGLITSYAWNFGDGDMGTGVRPAHTFATAGCYEVVLTVTDDGRASSEARTMIVVTAGAPGTGAPNVIFSSAPRSMQLVSRDLLSNKGTIVIAGTVSSTGYDSVVVRAVKDGAVTATDRTTLCSEASADPFELTIQIPAELASYDVEVYLTAGDDETLVTRAEDVVAGDVYVIQGQSNAVAARSADTANPGNRGPYLRSFGTTNYDPTASAEDNDWYVATGEAWYRSGSVGQWGIHLGRLLIDANGVPVAILNGAVGGKPISYFQRNDADPTELATNYGRLLRRARAAGVNTSVRAILYYQGESDGTDATGHRDGFIALYEDWLEDFPSLERVFITQIRGGCGTTQPIESLQLRGFQRRLANAYDGIGIMSTTGLDGHDGCHYSYVDGYQLLGQHYAALLLRDLYGGADAPGIDPPNPDRAYFSASDGTEITVVMRRSDQTLAWDSGAESSFMIARADVSVTSGRADGNTLVLTLSGDGRSADGAALHYVGHPGAGPWVTNSSGVGLLTFLWLPVTGP